MAPVENSLSKLMPVPDGFQEIQELLQKEKVEEALKKINGKSISGVFWTNAKAVCLMRMNKATDAVATLRPAVLEPNSMGLRPNIPLTLQINFATALAMSGNVQGANAILVQCDSPDNERVKSFKSEIESWRKDLTWMQRWQWSVGITVEKPLIPSPPVGGIQ